MTYALYHWMMLNIALVGDEDCQRDPCPACEAWETEGLAEIDSAAKRHL